MKITILLVGLLLCTCMIYAQESEESGYKLIANKRVVALDKKLDLTIEQKKDLYKLFYDAVKENRTKKKKVSKQEHKVFTKNQNITLYASIEDILSEQQKTKFKSRKNQR